MATTTVLEIADGVWSLARQHIVAEKVADDVRARALSIYSGLQRVGRVLGPLAAAVLVRFLPPQFGYLVVVLMAIMCLSIITRYTRSEGRNLSPTASTTSHPDGMWRGFFLAG